MTLHKTIECDICGREVPYSGHTRRLSLVSKVGPGVDGRPIYEFDYCDEHGLFRLGYHLFVFLAKYDGRSKLIPEYWDNEE